MKIYKLQKSKGMTLIPSALVTSLYALIAIITIRISTSATTSSVATCILAGNGVVSTSCDPRCAKDSSSNLVCSSLSATSNLQCSCGCSLTAAGVSGTIYFWPSQPYRCDNYCPPNYYGPTGVTLANNICQNCHIYCLTCNGGSNFNCLSCASTAYMLNSTACFNYPVGISATPLITDLNYNPCYDGYYGLQITMSCVACPTGCATCSIYLRQQMPGGNTSPTYFSATYNQNNIDCTGDPLCGYTIMCYTCVNGYTLINGLCISNSKCLAYAYYTGSGVFNQQNCVCFANYQIFGVANCIKCSIYCLTCSSITTTNCLTCPFGSTTTNAVANACNYNTTLNNIIENWVGGTPAISRTVAATGWYASEAPPSYSVNQQSCDSSTYVFGYYGYGYAGLPYTSSTSGASLFPAGAKLVYNNIGGITLAHYGIHIRATILFIDEWINGMTINFVENGLNRFQFAYQMKGVAGEYLCGLNTHDHMDVVDNWFSHTTSSITNLQIMSSVNGYAWGIKQIIIQAMTCHSTCTKCKGPTSSDCTGCPSNQTIVNGVCLCNSSAGYYNNSGSCDQSCGSLFRNPSTYACVSTCTWPYQFGFTNTSGGFCLVSCPSGFYKNYSNSICVSSCYQSSITNPSLNYYQFSGNDTFCNNTCPSGLYGDPKSGDCVGTCPTYNTSTVDGYFSYNYFCYEICPLATLFAYIPSRKCLTTCPSGYFKNYKLKPTATYLPPGLPNSGTNMSICEQQCSISNGGLFYYGDNTTGYCTNWCSSGTYGDIATYLCLTVCNSSAFGQSIVVNGATVRTCVVNCSLNNSLYGNPQTGFCVSSSNCPSNFFADSLTYLCTQTCSGALYFGDYANGSKICTISNCSNGWFKDNATKICVATCLNNDSITGNASFGDPVTKYCVANCYDIYYADAQYNMECVTICSATPSPTFGIDNICVKNCSNQTWADQYNPTRTCTTSCLYNGTVLSFGLNQTRLCVLYCPDGQFSDISSGIPLCKYGCPVNPNSSALGLFGNILNNTCVQNCPYPYYGDQTGNRYCVLLCPWPYYGSSCNNVTNVATNSSQRQCQLDCLSCGWADNFTQLCAWTSAGCSNSTFAHQNNHKCVYSISCVGFGDPVTKYCVTSCIWNTSNDLYFSYAGTTQRMCVLICPQNPNLFGDNVTKSCNSTCSGTTVRDPQYKRRCVNLNNCSSSPLLLYGDLVKSLCVVALNCSVGYYADNNSRYCINICPGPGSLYADNITRKCVSLCQLGYYALNVTVGKGICSLFCPQNLWADNLTVSCTSKCSNQTYGVNYTATWSAFNNSFSSYGICQTICPSNQYARDSDNLCVTDCGVGMWGDSLTGKCQTNPFGCSPGYYADDTTHTCVLPSACSPSNITSIVYVADNLTKTCVQICPSPNATYINYADMNKKLCVAQCPRGYYGFNSTKKCQQYCKHANGSNDGSYADYQINICVSICSAKPISTFGENGTYTCVEARYCPNNTWAEVTVFKRRCVSPCPGPDSVNGSTQTFGDNLTYSCVAQCPTYTYADLSQKFGLCVNVCPKINGTLQFADNSTKTCVTVCPLNQTWGQNSTLSCVKDCPPGSYAQRLPNRYCVKVCSPTTWGQTVKQTCVQLPQYCPTINGSLYYADNTTAMCVLYCPNITNTSSVNYWGQNTTRLCLPNCLTHSGLQSGFKWNQTKVCIDICPDQIVQEGSYSDNGMCYYVCMNDNYYRDPQYFRSCQTNCTFSPNKQYADPTTMKCVTSCPRYPQQLYAYNANKTCVATCLNNTRKYDATSSCVQVCPSNTLYNSNTNQCVDECPFDTVNNVTLYADYTLAQPACVPNTSCANNTFADDNLLQCVFNCTMGQWTYGKDCVAICPNGYYGNPNTFACVLPSNCPTNYYVDNQTVTCVANCSGSFADPNTRACVFVCPIVAGVIYFGDPTTRLCATTCTNNTSIQLIQNTLTQTCISQCQPGLFLQPYNNSCQQKCINGLYADNSTRICVSVCPITPSLFGENSSFTCVSQCLNKTEFRDIAGRVCVTACPANTYRDNITRNCVSNCLNSTYADPFTFYCVTNCTPYYSYDDQNTCIPQCPSPYFNDPTTFKCVTVCPTYPTAYFTAISSGVRTCLTSCPTNQYRDYRNFSCVSNCPLSPITFSDGNFNSCLADCSNGLYGCLTNRVCVSSCRSCSGALYADPLTGTCVSKCNPSLGYFGDATLSIPVCTNVCSFGTFADPFNQTCESSCINYPKMYGYDNGNLVNPIRQCVYSCPYPYVANNLTGKCVIYCTSSSGLPYVDQAAQYCVANCSSPVYQYSYMPLTSINNGSCVKFCPNGTFSLLTNNSCVSECPDGLFGSTTNNTCFSSCTLANNEYGDPYNNLCMSVCTHSSTYFSYADQFSRLCVTQCPKDKFTFGDQNIWKCVERCSNLSQYADPTTQTCVGQCPTSYFADNVTQTCLLNCSVNTLSYGDTTNRICVNECLTTTLYADDATRLCISSFNCSNGFFGLNSSRTCIAQCPTSPDLFGDPVTQTCVYGCSIYPIEYYADYVSRTCLLKCPSVPALYGYNISHRCLLSCPPGTYADNYTRYCIQVCSTIPIQTFADNSTYQCVAICPTLPNTYALNTTWQCVPQCPSPLFYADNSTRSCVNNCPKGSINTFADNSSRSCVPVCPNNTFNQNSTQRCVSQCLTGFADPRTKFCVAICPRYSYGDNSTLSCVTGCPVYFGKQTFAEDSNNLCMFQCLAIYNTIKDYSTNRCVKICPISNSSFADVSTRTCVTQCPQGQNITYADSSTRYCVSICPSVPAMYAISQTNNVCTSMCPNNSWADNNSRSCLGLCLTSPQTFGENTTWACVITCPTKPNTYANNDTHFCVLVCPSIPDFYADNITRKCVYYCPNNTFADPTTRTCVTTCPLGYYGQNDTLRCVQLCPSLSFADNLTHLCLAKCSVDPILYGNPDSHLCVQLCPIANNSYGNPLTQQCVDYQSNGTSGCPITYFADNHTRLCVQVCPMTQDTYGDNSTWKCVIKCPGGSINTFSDNSTMRCVSTCPSYPDFYAEPYSRRCVHYCLSSNGTFTGSFSDNSTRTCTQQCPSLPDYYSDNSTLRCVFYCPRYPQTYADFTTRRCVAICPSDSVNSSRDIFGDNSTLRCVAQCPRNQSTFADYTTRMCVSVCPSVPPLYAENTTLKCLANCTNSSYADNLTRKCVAVCPRYPETYGDPTTNSCVTMCPPSYFADPITQNCVLHCPNGSYAENTTRRCLISCPDNLVNYADNTTNQCVSQCPANYSINFTTYGDNETQSCVTQCPNEPFTFADNMTQMCLDICNNVSSGGYADNVTRRCLQVCPNLSYGDITTRYCVTYCPSGWYAYDLTNLCVGYCPSPYFGDNSTWRCVLQCPRSQNLFGEAINNTCVSLCPNGTYASQENQQCVIRCPNSSQTLLNYSTFGYNVTKYCVDECPVPLYGYPVAQVCVNSCPNPYYENITDHLCYKCPLECASCLYPQLCLTCVPNHYLYSGSCVQSCPTFPIITFANPNLVCGTASECTQGYYALNSTKSCVQTCPAGFFINILSQTCDPCLKGCINCVTSTSCLACNSNVSVWSNYNCYLFCSKLNKFYGTTGCVASCPAGTYLNLTTCQSCSTTCSTCVISAQNCLICANGYYISNGICVSTCPSNTQAKIVNGSQTCISCSLTNCQVTPLTFTTSQFVNNFKYNVQIQFNQPVNITQQLSKVIQLQSVTTHRLLVSTYQYLDYTIIDYGNGLYSFVLNNYNPSSNSQLQIQILNPSAIIGQNGQIPQNTRSTIVVDTSNIYSLSDYIPQIDQYLQAVAIIAFILLILTFTAHQSIWMPIYDFLQLLMALILVNITFPPNLLYSIFGLFASALTFLPNFFSKSFTQAFYSQSFVNNNIYSVMQDSSFLRILGNLYFILIVLGSVLLLFFILSKKCPNKQLKKWCKEFIRQIFWKKHLHGIISFFFLPVFLLGVFNMRLYSYFNSTAIQGFSIFSSYLFMILFTAIIIYWIYRLRKLTKDHPIVYLMLQKAYNFITYQKTVLIQNNNHYFSYQKNQVDLSNARQPRINQLLIFPFTIETKVGPWDITQPLFNYLHKFLTALFLTISFNNQIIQLILLIIINISYIVYFIIRKPFYSVKKRQFNNEIYIHNLIILSIIEIVLLIFAFMNTSLSNAFKVTLGNAICAFIIEGATVNIIYMIYRTYNYHHHYTWKKFVRSEIFRINYTVQHLDWTKQYDINQNKLKSETRPRNQFLEAIQVQLGQSLANMARQNSISSLTRQKMKALQLRPNRGDVVTKQYSQMMKTIANEKEKSHSSVASSERMSKNDRKRVRDLIFGQKQQFDKDEKYQKLAIIDQKSEIKIQNIDISQLHDDEVTQYEYEFIQEQYPQGTPMEQILKDCKKGDVILPL